MKSDKYWKQKLTPEQYEVLRKSKTEKPFYGKYYKHSKTGIYKCAACGYALFDSETKYESGSGWPSFYDVLDSKNIRLSTDYLLIYPRIEVKCANCGSHLGHLFDDGPNPTGKRYCVNSLSLDFESKK